jgi:hypothetical protein
MPGARGSGTEAVVALLRASLVVWGALGRYSVSQGARLVFSNTRIPSRNG